MRAPTQHRQAIRSSAIRDTATTNTTHADTNEQPSGSHYPRWDPDRCTPPVRRRKARHVDGAWVHCSDALDSLVGVWNEEAGTREDGIGFHLLSELTWHAGGRTTPIEPTVITKVGEVPLAIDHLIANEAMLRHLVADSFRRLPAPGDEQEASDHIAVYAELIL